MSLPSGQRACLYDAKAVEAVLDRMAQGLAASLGRQAPVALVGVLRRGAPLADQLAQRLVQQHGFAPPLRLDLEVKRYADDLTLLYPQTRLTEPRVHAELHLEGHTVVVVDDVLYTGHSMMRVLEYLMTKGPQAVLVAVLADRHATTLPIRADLAGVHLQLAPGDVVECHVPPYEPDWRIEWLRPATTP